MLLILDSGRMLEGDGFIQRFNYSGVLHTLRLLSKICSQEKSTRYDASTPPLWLKLARLHLLRLGIADPEPDCYTAPGCELRCRRDTMTWA